MIPQSFAAEDAEDVLGRFAADFLFISLEPALRELLPIIHQGLEDNFLAAVGPSGTAWPARKDNKPHPLLILTGALIEAARDTGGTGHIDRVSDRQLETGIDGNVIKYAPTHENGYSGTVTTKAGKSYQLTIPARPYMYASDLVQQQIEDKFADEAVKLLVGE